MSRNRRTPPSRRTTPARRTRTGSGTPPGRVGTWTLRLTGALLYGSIFFACSFGGLVLAALPQLPGIERSPELRQHEGKLFARDGRTVLRTLRSPTSRRYARQRDVPPVLMRAVMAAEDRRFEQHHGIDPRGIARAALVDLHARELREGGSTITQQLVKNTYLGPERSVARKSREAVLAVALDARWKKRRIMTAYLNTAYFGQGAYGVTDAAEQYFGVPVRELGVAESALLAGLLRAPEGDNPITAPRRARAARARVLDAMLDLGMISPRQHRRALRAPLPDAAAVQHRRSGGHELAPHFADAVTGELIDRFGVARALSGGLRVKTTIDPAAQSAAMRAVGELGGSSGLSSALAAVDPARGEVRALAVGGAASGRAFDIASIGARQPGSAFKPFVLAAAFQRGYLPTSRVESAPFTATYAGATQPFTVKNASHTYAGQTTLERATWASDNTVFARIGDDIGPGAVAEAAQASGIRAHIEQVPSVVLGALPRGVSPVELASAYGTFAAHGVHVTGERGGPLRILEVRDRRGRVLYSARRTRTQAMPRVVADLVTATLRGVIDGGTGTAAAIGRPAAGKTGTTENHADAWFAGYTPELATAVWVGHSEGAVPMLTEHYGGPVSGGTFPARIWASFMQEALEGRAARDFELEQPRIVEVRIDAETRLLADAWCTRAVRERFIEGLEPTEQSSDCPAGTRAVPDVRGVDAEEARAQLEQDGFRVRVIERSGRESELGLVTSQRPLPGRQVGPSDRIELSVVGRVFGSSSSRR